MSFRLELTEPYTGAGSLHPLGRQAVPARLDLAMLLDGRYAGTLPATRPKRLKQLGLELKLPRLQAAQQLDLIDPGTGESVLDAPHDLSRHYRIEVRSVAARTGKIVGEFTAPALGERLWVECRIGDRVIARGFGLRDAGAEAVHRFELKLRSLLDPNRAEAATLHVAGASLRLDGLALEPAAAGYVGFIDHTTPGLIAGWALALSSARRRASVDLVIDGDVRATVVADEFREDLRNAGISDGFSGFRFTLAASRDFSVAREVSVLVSGTSMELLNSPVMATPAPAVRGSFDRLHGMSAHGWAMSDVEPETPVRVEAVCDGEVLGSAEAKLFRGDLLEAGLNEGFCAFKIDMGARVLELLGREIHVRIAGTDFVLGGSPRIATQNPNLLRYLRPWRDVAAATLPRLVRALDHRVGPIGLSIVMPVHDTPQAWLVQAIESVRRQWCTHWELLCINDASTAPHIQPLLRAYAKADQRIRVLNTDSNVGIASACNFGLRAARGAFIAFMDHDDLLEPDAVYHLLRTAAQTGADFIYSDEATTDENIDSIAEVKARPAFSYDYYLSHPYFVHMLCVRRELAYEVGGWDGSMAISADVDFVLRVLGAAKRVAHVPRVLYRWRTHGGSTGHAKMDAVMEATRGAIQRHLDRHRPGATVQNGVWFNQFRVDWPETDGRILIVIPTKNRFELVRTAIDSIARTAGDVDYQVVIVDHESDEAASRAYFETLTGRHVVMRYEGAFNYSRMNNEAVRQHGAGSRFVLFLNNDVEAIHAGWLDRMRRLANREEVGAVGALLLYPDDRVQHAGVIMGFNGSADHAFKFESAYLDKSGRRNLGYNCSLTSVRDFSAITAACMMMRTEVFEAIGGFDESFGVGFNDTDICLRLREAGLKVLYDGHSRLYHYESATRSKTKQILHPEDTTRLLTRHARILAEGDPFYNPNLSVVAQDHVLREDEGCKRGRPRVTDMTATAPSLAMVEAHRVPPPAPAAKAARPGRKPRPAAARRS